MKKNTTIFLLIVINLSLGCAQIPKDLSKQLIVSFENNSIITETNQFNHLREIEYINKIIFSKLSKIQQFKLDTLFIVNGYDPIVSHCHSGRIWNSQIDIRYKKYLGDTLQIFSNYKEYYEYHINLVGMLPKDYLKEYYPLIENWNIGTIGTLQEKYRKRRSDWIYIATLIKFKNKKINIKHVEFE